MSSLVPVVCVAGAQGPVPELEDVRRLGAGHQHAPAAALSDPQGGAGATASNLHPLGFRLLDQRRQSDAQRVADPQQGPDARVRGPLLNVHQHPPTDASCGGELVQRPATGMPQVLHPRSDREREGSRIIVHRCIILHYRVHLRAREVRAPKRCSQGERPRRPRPWPSRSSGSPMTCRHRISVMEAPPAADLGGGQAMLSDDRQRGLEGPAATEQELTGEWFAQWLSKVNCVFGQDVEENCGRWA